MTTHPAEILPCAAVLLLYALPSFAAGQDPSPPLVVERDSAGVEIVEAMRPLWGDSSLWSIDPEPLVDLTLSGGGTPHEFFRVQGVKQRPDGSIVVGDGGSREVRLYSTTGEFLGSFGGRGDGPGEFRGLQAIDRAGDTLLALGRGRVTVAAPDLAVVRTFTLAPFTNNLHYLGSGAILTESYSPGPQGNAPNEVNRHAEPLILFDLDGVRIDSIGEMRGTESYAFVRDGMVAGAPPLFGKTSHIAVLGQRIFRGSAITMQVEELDMTGRLVRIIRIPGYPLDLSDAQVAAERDARLGGFRPGSTSVFRRLAEDLPDARTRPAYAEILVDPSGAIWLELFRGESEQDQPREWVVLDADGTWLGTVEVPRRFTVMEITMDTVLGVREDELDVEHPQVLRLTRN
ncbi:MAG: hypothetical protein F4151_16125 [Gammaproteobacteria bacterium]|nr:hypothetical protein [Gammaproteobacteria bacterium]